MFDIKRLFALVCLLLMSISVSADLNFVFGKTLQAASIPDGVPIKVMSFNIMYDKYYGKPETDPNAWNCASGPGRRDRVIRMIMSESQAFGRQGADIIGVQETIQNQANDLKSAMTGYDCCGVVGKTGCEACRIFYRSDRFTKLDSGTFWLSQTPDVPGSICPGAAHPRIGSWVKLTDCRNQKSYFVLNTHFDYKNAAANKYSAGLIRDKIAALSEGAPVIVMGDLNTKETTDAYLKLTGRQDPNEFQLTDTYRYIFIRR
jgi:endonuclease/exonuclease/phosphatase family metal-dependent hydrolase